MRLEPRKSCLIFVGLPGTTKQTSSAVKQLHQNKRQCLFGYDAGPWTAVEGVAGGQNDAPTKSQTVQSLIPMKVPVQEG